MFPIHAFPPAFACAVIVALAVTSLFYARRDRISVSFALFCFAWAVVAAVTLWLQITGDLLAARAAPAALWTTYIFMANYIFALTATPDRPSDTVLGVGTRTWMAIMAITAVAAGTISISTTLVVTGLHHDAAWGYGPRFNVHALFFHVPFALLMLYGLQLLHRESRRETSAARTAFLRNNLYALGAIIMSTAVFAAILPRLGVPSFPLIFDAFTLVAFFFFGIIANYQYRRVEELNANLEQQVADRTQALREAQAQLVQAEKMVALGRLVAGIAHEINTPLGAVRSAHDTRSRATSALLKLTRDDSTSPARVGQIEKALSDGDRVSEQGLLRIDSIVKRLKSFARLDESELQTVDLNQSIEEILDLLGTELDGAKIDRHFSATRKITCMSRQMNQVFLNVLTNAAQAVDHQGVIRVETIDAHDGVEVRIHDNGPGIAPEHRPHVFDPGFTTRGVGVGTGMGLAIAYRVVLDHGGTIAIDSELGAGTCVTVNLPVSLREETADRARQAAAS